MTIRNRTTSPRTAIVRVLLAGMLLVWAASSTFAQNPPWLAPEDVDSTTLQRLPHAHSVASDSEWGLDVVSHAAGGVELLAPSGWQSYETPIARSVRLVVARQPMENPHTAGDGLWLVYHVAPAAEMFEKNTGATPAIQQELAEQMERLMALATNHFATTTRSSHLFIDGWPALRHDFELADPADSENTSPADSENTSPADSVNTAPFWNGFHCLTRTPWGLVEIHAVAPASIYTQREKQFQAILDSLLLGQPHLPPHRADPPYRDASPVLGSWKSYRSRLRLYHDGGVELAYDAPRDLTLDQRGKISPPAALPRLRGRYTARGDLLRITWRDGSLLNYRWKLNDGQLLLTDHTGRNSLLNPIYE